MGKKMVWMYEYPFEELNAKGQKVITTEWRLEPREGSKKVYVQYYTPKGKPNDTESL
jgi:hypothetical protein